MWVHLSLALLSCLLLRQSPPTWLGLSCPSSEFFCPLLEYLLGCSHHFVSVTYQPELLETRDILLSFQKSAWYIVGTQFRFVKIIPAFYFLHLPRFQSGTGSWGRSWAVNTKGPVVNSMLPSGFFTVLLLICPQLLIGAVMIPLPDLVAYLGSYRQSGNPQPEALFCPVNLPPKRHLCVSDYEKYNDAIGFILSGAGNKTKDVPAFVFCVLLFSSQFTVLYIAVMCWRGSMFRILSVRLYVKRLRRVSYMDSFYSLSSLNVKNSSGIYVMCKFRILYSSFTSRTHLPWEHNSLQDSVCLFKRKHVKKSTPRGKRCGCC